MHVTTAAMQQTSLAQGSIHLSLYPLRSGIGASATELHPLTEPVADNNDNDDELPELERLAQPQHMHAARLSAKSLPAVDVLVAVYGTHRHYAGELFFVTSDKPVEASQP